MTGFASIIWRELTVASRQKGTFRSRVIIGGVTLSLFVAFLVIHNAPPNVIGPRLFGIFSTLLFVLALLMGVRLTSDCLSEEKREGTLCLLFLADLSAGEVVMAKMSVRALRGLYAMLATIPVFSFCILMGGVRGIEPVFISLDLLSTMIFSLAVGVFVSSRSLDDRAAFLGTFGLLLAFVFLPLLFWKVSSFHFLLSASPGYAFFRAAPSIATPWEFWRCLAFQFACAGGLLFAAARHLRKSFHDQFAQTTKSPNSSGVEELYSSGKRLEGRRESLDANPFLWLLDQKSSMREWMRGFVVLAVVAGLVGAFITATNTPGPLPAMCILAVFGLHMAWKILLTSDALRRLHGDHRSGALELLLSTPLPVEDILRAQWLRTWRIFRPSAIALCLVSAVIFTQKNFRDLFVVPIGGALFLFIDARALSWRAMLQALRPGRFPEAVLRVMGLVIVLPMAAIVLILFGMKGFGATMGNMLFFFYFLACAIFDSILVLNAKRVLNGQFRYLASQPSSSASRKET